MKDHADTSDDEFDNESSSSARDDEEGRKRDLAMLSERAMEAFSGGDEQDAQPPAASTDATGEQEAASSSMSPPQSATSAQASASDDNGSFNSANALPPPHGTPGMTQGWGTQSHPASWAPQPTHMQHGTSPGAFFQEAPEVDRAPVRHKKRLSKEDRQRALLNYLGQTYQALANLANNVVLMERRSGMLFPERSTEVRKEIKATFFHQHGLEITSKEIASALEKFTAFSCVQASFLPVFGRAGCINSRFRVINSHHGYYLFDTTSPLPTPPSPVGLPVPFPVPFVVPHRSLSLPSWFQLDMYPCNDFEQRFWVETGLPKDTLLVVLAWMVLGWMPDKKQVMLEMRGSGDDSQVHAQRVIKRILDPSRSPGDTALPTGKVALEKHAQQEYLLSLERIDSLTPYQQKGLFEFLQGKEVDWVWNDGKKTGMNIQIQCPVMMSCLESPLTYAPLVERKVSVDTATNAEPRKLHPVDDELFNPLFKGFLLLFGHIQERLWSPFNKSKKAWKEGVLSDLCTIGELVAAYFGRSPDAFWDQLNSAKLDIHEDALEADDIAQIVKKCSDDNEGAPLEMSMTEWLEALEKKSKEVGVSVVLPERAKGLSIRFKKARKVLEPYGILMTSVGRKGSDRRAWRVEKAPVPSQGDYLL